MTDHLSARARFLVSAFLGFRRKRYRQVSLFRWLASACPSAHGTCRSRSENFPECKCHSFSSIIHPSKGLHVRARKERKKEKKKRKGKGKERKGMEKAGILYPVSCILYPVSCTCTPSMTTSQTNCSLSPFLPPTLTAKSIVSQYQYLSRTTRGRPRSLKY